MSTTISTPTALRERSRRNGLIATLKTWWVAYLVRRIERAAIIQLQAMSDRELRDLGLSRSHIAWAVEGERDGGSLARDGGWARQLRAHRCESPPGELTATLVALPGRPPRRSPK